VFLNTESYGMWNSKISSFIDPIDVVPNPTTTPESPE
jgi:hypothetical protein